MHSPLTPALSPQAGRGSKAVLPLMHWETRICTGCEGPLPSGFRDGVFFFVFFVFFVVQS